MAIIIMIPYFLIILFLNSALLISFTLFSDSWLHVSLLQTVFSFFISVYVVWGTNTIKIIPVKIIPKAPTLYKILLIGLNFK